MTAVATVTPDGSGAAPHAGRGRSARQFWEIPKAGWRDIAVRTWQETNEDNISLLAAGVAFYSFLAFVPMLAAIMLVYGIVADPADVAGHLEALTRILPTDAVNRAGFTGGPTS